MKNELTLLTSGIKSTIWYSFTLLLIGIFSLFSSAVATASNPCCVVPPNTYLNCDDLPYDFDPYDANQRNDLFGAAGWSNGCVYYNFTELDPVVNLNSCEIGTITRRYSVIDPGNWGDPSPTICTQTIQVKAVHDYEIRFPKDMVAYCTTPAPEAIEYNEIGCDLLAVSTNDMVFNTGVDACYKVFRKYRVINWCEYDGESPAIKIERDEDCDGSPGDEAVWVLRRSNNIIYTDRTSIQFDNDPPYIELDPSCGHDGQAGYWRSLPVYESAANMYNGGFYEYTQHIKVTDNVDPEIEVETPDPFCSLSSDFAGGCPGDVTLPFTVIEDCTNSANVKLFVFMYNVPVALTPENDQFDELVSGSFPNYVINARLPLGVHSFEIHVNDGCGNSNSELVEVRVVDCKAPTPVCLHGLSTSLMPLEPNVDADGDGDTDEGAVEVWATDFVFSPVFDCNGPVSYSINFDGETPNINQSNLVITCEDGDSVLVEIYAWDTAYNPYAVQPNGIAGGPNYDHCETYIKVADNLALCPGASPIVTLVDLEGSISTELGNSVADVMVYLESDNPNMMMTQIDGDFNFEDLNAEYTYEITPYKDGNDLESVNTADLISLAKHLMGIRPLQSPYLRIAADIDNNSTINMADFLALRDVILGVHPEFMDNTSWRFIDKSFAFSNMENPWAEELAESIVLEDLETDEVNLDFVGVKVGDLRANAILTYQANVEGRTDLAPVKIELEDQMLVKGQSYSIDITFDVLENVAGYQFGLALNDNLIAVEDIAYGLSDEQHILTKEQAAVRTSWDYFSAAATPVAYEEDVRIYTLNFVAGTDALLSEVLSLENEQLAAQAYTVDGEEQAIQLVFTNAMETTEMISVKPAWPNPFKETIQLAFFLPETTEMAVSVMDISGRIVKQFTGSFQAGENTLEIDLSDNAGSGIYYLNLKSDNFNESQRIVRLK